MEPIANDRLAGISAFVAAVEAGSFAQAGARLGLTRSAVGKAITRLEARLGARLFVRTTRNLRLTDEGQLFYERCAGALEELNAAQLMLEAGRNEVTGRLRISAPVVFGRHHVAPVLLDLAQRHQGLRIDASFSDRLADFVDEGIDLAVRSGTLPESDTLVARPIGMQVMAVCASPTYLEAHGTPSALSDLASHRCIEYLHAGPGVSWSFTDERGAIVQPALTRQLGFDDLDAIAEAAIRGVGLAYLPLWRVREALDDGRLVRVLTHVPSAVIPLHLVWPRMRFMPYKIRVTIDALLLTLPSQLPSG